MHMHLLLRSEIPSRMYAKLRTVAASNNRDHLTRSLLSSPLASTINCLPGSQALLEFTHQDHSFGITLLLLVRTTHIYFCSLHTSRSWWITQSMQHHRRDCNNIPSFLQRTTPITRSLCEGWTRHDLHILVTAAFCCNRKSRAACAQSFAKRQQATIEIMCRNLSYYCLLTPRVYIFVLRAHLIRGESHNQRNTTGEVATQPFFQQKLESKNSLQQLMTRSR